MDVIHALRGHSQAEEWTVMTYIEQGRKILEDWKYWKMIHTSNNCNRIAHNVTN